MLNFIDNFLNQYTMYWLVLNTLRVFVVVAVVLAFFGLLPFSPWALIFSILFLTLLGWITNKVFAWAFDLPVNVESYAISAYILALIIKPPTILHGFGFLFWAIVLTIGSKFIVAIGKKHLFNPAAFAVALTALTLGDSANWWIGSRIMLPVVLIGGFLIVRKMQRFDLLGSFLGGAIISTICFGLLKGTNPLETLTKVFLDSPIVFFATIMLTEPMTTPPKRDERYFYGLITGLLFAPELHVGGFYSTPELALLVGNLYSYIVSPKLKLLLTLREKIQTAPDEWDFVFAPDDKLVFTPGQYMEWTLPPDHMDSRGNRRYFTLASAPSEENVRLGIKYYEKPSSYKQKLLKLNPGDRVLASQLSGEFILDKDEKRKYVFLAGGIGITPYRSIIKHLIDANEHRDIVLVYADKTEKELVYREVFSAAEPLGLRNIYVLSEKESLPAGWQGKAGHIDGNLISSEVPDFKERYFYLSGSHGFVVQMEKVLKEIGIPRSQIKKDFFPGFV